MRNYLKIAGNFIMPNLCPICLEATISKEEDCCHNCQKQLTLLPTIRCTGCGGGIDGSLDLCSECLRNEDRPWEHAVSAFPFCGTVRKLIHRYKYQGHTYLAPFFAKKMYEAWLQYGNEPVDIVTPIPLHWLKKILRGYNQAELLSNFLAKQLKIPEKELLFRKRWTKQQALLNSTKRQKNMKKSFANKRSCNFSSKHILLVDDILTTGATLSAATKILKTTNNKVTIITIARG